MTPVVQAARKRHEQAGSLAEELPYFAWVDERTLLTRQGELVTLAELQPAGIAGQPAAELDRVLAVWMRLLGQLEDEVRFSLIVTRRPVDAAGVAGLSDERLSEEIFRERARELAERNGELRFYAAWTLDARLRDAGRQGGGAGGWIRRLRRPNGKGLKRWLASEIAAASGLLARVADASRALVSDVCPNRALGAQEGTRVLADLINRPGAVVPSHEGGALNWAWGLSDLEAHRRHLTLDGEPLSIYSIVEPPPEAAANILWDLLSLQGVWSWVWEWRGLTMGQARGRMRSAQKHFFSARYSMIAHAQGTEATDAALLDSAAAAESAKLGEALVELQSDGIPWGELAASLSVHAATTRQLEEIDSSVVKIFAGRDIKILREGYGQLSAWFARLPGQPASRQLRRMPVSAGTALCCAPLFAPGRGHAVSKHLDAPALATFETRARTLYDYDLFNGADVGHSVILGSTGSGKSFLLNFLLVNALRYSPRIAILDLGGAYRHLTSMLGGSYLRLDGEAGSAALRPFSLPKSKRTLLFLTGWIERLLRLGGYETSGEDTTEIQARLEDLYNLAASKRRMSGLVETMPARMKPAMTRWTQGGQWGRVFDPASPAKGGIGSGDWQVIDLSGAAEHPDLVSAALTYCLEKLRLQIERDDEIGRLKLLVVDEAWKFLAEPATANYLGEAARTWRKRNAALVLATQSVADVVGGAASAALIESMPNRLYLSNRDLSDEAAAGLQLTKAEAELIRGLLPKREMYARSAAGAEVLTLAVDRRSYWLYTSNPRESEQRAEVLKRTGDLRTAIEELARGGA